MQSETCTEIQTRFFFVCVWAGGGGGTGSLKLEHCAYINAVSPEEAAHIPKEKT